MRGSVAEVLDHFRAHEPKGEFVIVVEGYDPKRAQQSVDDDEEDEQ